MSWYRLLVRGGWLLVYYRVVLASTIVFAIQTRSQGQQTLIIMNNNVHLSLNALSAHMIHILCLVTLLWSVEKKLIYVYICSVFICLVNVPVFSSAIGRPAQSLTKALVEQKLGHSFPLSHLVFISVMIFVLNTIADWKKEEKVFCYFI